ncbi:MAG: PHP domain-containing protein [Prevotellaceae bacterium]|nr:PHP domain-containing protein [Prevotellaceae bacterium]
MFTHLHVHTQYSVLDGASAITDLFATAKADNQKALAITDHGNMYGVKESLRRQRLRQTHDRRNIILVRNLFCS